MKTKWEPLPQTFENDQVYSERLTVPGGWLVRTRYSNSGGFVTTIFISDPEHLWEM